MGSVVSRRAALTTLAGAFVLQHVPTAKAADRLRVGKASAENFGNVPLDVGMEYGIFDRLGLTIEKFNFGGGSRVAQAMVAGSVDIALSGGPEMAFVAKGAPEIAVASISSSAAFMGLVVGAQSTARGVDDLKGQNISIASVGSVTEWMVEALNRSKGWTAPGDRMTPVVAGGSTQTTLATLKSGAAAASLTATQVGFAYEAQNAGRLLIDCSSYVGSFEIFTTYASTALVNDNPDALRRFLKGWYESVAFMKTHKAETVQVTAKVTGYPLEVATRLYDMFMGKFSTDGRWDPQAIETLRRSFADLKTIDGPIDMTKLYTDRFLP